MTHNGQPEDPNRPKAFAVDTVPDKAVRFGCGAALAFLLLVAIGMFGLPEALGGPALVTLATVLVVGAGFVSVTHGEPFIRALLKVVKWLS